MSRTSFGRWGLALVLMSSTLLSACETTSPYQAAPFDKEANARYHAISPLADLDTAGLTYVGDLPVAYAPLAPKTDELTGENMFVNTQVAIQALNKRPGANGGGEAIIRGLIPKNVKMCGRVMIQRMALTELRRQSDAVEDSGQRVRNRRNAILAGGAVSEVAGGILAASKYGPAYGGIVALGSVLPALGNQYVYKMVLDQGDMQNALWLAQGRYWYNQNDFWLDSMEQWCPSFMNWVGNHGQIVNAGGNPSPAQPTPFGPRRK